MTTTEARAQYEMASQAARDAHDEYVTAGALPLREQLAAYKQWQLAIETRKTAADELLMVGYAELSR